MDTQPTWNIETIKTLFEKPFFDLIAEAFNIHRKHFPVPDIQISALLNIKTGACPEDCAYCPQSVQIYKTDVPREKLWGGG